SDTIAISNTIHALRASARKNSFHCVTALPLFVSTVLNNFTPRISTLAKPAMLSDSINACGRAKRHNSPTTNGTPRLEISSMRSPFEFVLFFQAEDGIRDWSVLEFRRVLFR